MVISVTAHRARAIAAARTLCLETFGMCPTLSSRPSDGFAHYMGPRATTGFSHWLWLTSLRPRATFSKADPSMNFSGYPTQAACRRLHPIPAAFGGGHRSDGRWGRAFFMPLRRLWGGEGRPGAAVPPADHSRRIEIPAWLWQWSASADARPLSMYMIPPVTMQTKPVRQTTMPIGISTDLVLCGTPAINNPATSSKAPPIARTSNRSRGIVLRTNLSVARRRRSLHRLDGNWMVRGSCELADKCRTVAPLVTPSGTQRL